MKRIVALAALLGLVGPASAKELYVSANNSIVSFDPATLASQGAVVAGGVGGLLRATGVAQGPDGDLYVSNPIADTVLVFDGASGASLGTFLDENDRLRGPAGLAFGVNSHLYVANRFRNEIVEFDLDGNIVNVFADAAGALLVTPEDVEFGPDGLLYVADANNNRIVRIDPVALTAAEFVSPGLGGLDYPHGLAFDGSGNLFVASHFSDEIIVYDTAGDLVGTFASVVEPVGIAIDAGEVSVVSFGNSTLQLFSAAGVLESTVVVPANSSYLTVVDRPILTQLSRTVSSVFGGCQDTVITATIDRPAPAGGAVVSLTNSVPAALTVPATLLIPAGQTTASFTAVSAAVAAQVTTEVRGTAFGVSRSTFVTVKPIGLATGTAAITLTPTTVAGGATSAGRVTLFCPAQLGPITVSLSSSNGIATVPASVSIGVGSSFADFTVSTSSPANSTIVAISATLDRTQARNLTVTPSSVLTSVNLVLTSLTGGLSTTGTVTISAPAPAGGLTVSLATNIGQASVPASVVVLEGATTANFTLSSTQVASSTNGILTASLGGISVTRNFILRAVAVLSVSLSPSSIRSNQTSTGTVTLETAAGAGGVVVTLTSQSPGVAVPTTGTVTVAPGATTANFVVQAATVATRQTARIVAQAQNTTTTKFAIITVNP